MTNMLPLRLSRFITLVILTAFVCPSLFATEIDEGAYYLYNEESGMFLSRGSSWGTRAVLAEYGIPLTATHNLAGSETYMRFQFADYYADRYLGNPDNQVDVFGSAKATASVNFDVQSLTDGCYALRLAAVSDAGSGYLCSDYQRLVFSNASLTDAAHWSLLSPDEYNKIQKSRDEEKQNPAIQQYKEVSVTSSIYNADMSKGMDGWEWTSHSDREGNTISTSGHYIGVKYGAGSLSRTLTGLTPGWYRLQYKAFYCYNTSDFGACTDWESRGYNTSAAYVSAGSVTGHIKAWASGHSRPRTLEEANTSIGDDEYNGSICFRVPADGKATVSFVNTNYHQYGWLVVGGIELSYLEPSEQDEDTPIVDGGKYYIKNVDNGQWLNAGATWGTHLITNSNPLDLTLQYNLDGKYQIETGIYNGDRLHYIGADSYVDQAAVDIEITNCGNGEYAFCYNGQYLKVAEGGSMVGWTRNVDPLTDARARWSLHTYAELYAKIDEASPENPVDVTFLLPAAHIRAHDSRNSNWQGYNYTINEGAAESFHTSGFDFYQELTDLPRGRYLVRCQGYYRYGNSREVNDEKNGQSTTYIYPYAVATYGTSVDRRWAKLYANNAEVGLANMMDYCTPEARYDGDVESMMGWVRNSMKGAVACFDDGYYHNEVIAPVVDGNLRLGVHKSQGYQQDWAMFDNFELYYLGPEGIVPVQDVRIEESKILLAEAGTAQIHLSVFPDNASNKTMTYSSSNTSVATVDANGLVKASKEGSATITITPNGFDEHQKTSYRLLVEVKNGTPASSNVIINEIMVANNGLYIDPSFNYGGWVEIYNPSDLPLSTHNLYVSDDRDNLMKVRLHTGAPAIPAHGFGNIWFDHYNTGQGTGQADMKLNVNGGTIFISDNQGNLLASQTYPAYKPFTSYARKVDAGNEWCYTSMPTPQQSNTITDEAVSHQLAQTQPAVLPLPEVSQPSHMFTSPFDLTVTIPSGTTLRYTLDGSIPTWQHGEVSTDGHFHITATTILRMRLFQDGMVPSDVLTRSYIYKDREYTLPFVSIVTDDDNLYSDSIGMFVVGTNGIRGHNLPANWNCDWERPANFEYFPTTNSDVAFSQQVDITMSGAWSRCCLPHSVKVKSSEMYTGEDGDFLPYSFFEEKAYNKHKAIVLRNGGNDYYGRIRDAALQQMAATTGLTIDYQEWKPVHVFVNGVYQGMQNLREPNNKHFAYANYGVKSGDIDFLEVNSVKEGDGEAFNRLLSLSYNAADEDTYNEITKLFDMDEMINYFAILVYLGNNDWPWNNFKSFRGRTDGRFHIVLFDLDYALRLTTSTFTHIGECTGQNFVRILHNMLNNNDFRRRFIDTMCMMGGSVYEQENVDKVLNLMGEQMRQPLSMEAGHDVDKSIREIRWALVESNRYQKILQAMRDYSPLQLSDSPSVDIKFNANISEAHLEVNGTFVPNGRFNGTLFLPVTLTAIAPEGYEFLGWVDAEENIVCSDADIDLDESSANELTALFAPLSADVSLQLGITPVRINEVSACNDIYVNEHFKKNDWIELYNTTDRSIDVAGMFISDDISKPQKYQIKADKHIPTTIPAKGHLLVWADELISQSQLHAPFKLSSTGGHVMLTAQNGEWTDTLTYQRHLWNQSVGRYPDGANRVFLMDKPSIARTNVGGSYFELVKGQYKLHLAEGWNWVSHDLQNGIPLTQLPISTISVLSQEYTAYNDNQLGWLGSLHSLSALEGYKIHTSQEVSKTYVDNYRINSQTLHDNDNQVRLTKGWNWLSYPINRDQSLTRALTNYVANEGDVILSQGSFAEYHNGQWTGTLNTLQTGCGYMMHVAAEQSFAYHLPTLNRSSLNPRQRQVSAFRDTICVDPHLYPNQMAIIADIEVDGEEMDADNYTVYVLSGQEVRGRSYCIDGRLYISVSGEDDEALQMLVTDADGQMFQPSQTLLFGTQVLGSSLAPYLIALSTQSETDTMAFLPEEIQGSTEIFTLGGIRASALHRGINLIRKADGKVVKVVKK